MQTCREHNIIDATAYLYEKNGEFEEAFKVLSDDFKNSVEDTKESNINDNLSEIKQKMMTLIEFCQRSSFKLTDPKEVELFWFTLLEDMLHIKQVINALKNNSELTDNSYQTSINKFNELTNSLLNGMIGYIDLLSLLQRIIRDPLYSGENGKLCDIKELMMGMLDTYNYQETVLQTTNSLLLTELHTELQHLRHESNKALTNRTLICSVCLKSLTLGTDVIVLKCAHSFHQRCANVDSDSAKCVICYSSAKNESIVQSKMNNQHMNPSNPFEDYCVNNEESVKLNENQLKVLSYMRKTQRSNSNVRLDIIFTPNMI